MQRVFISDLHLENHESPRFQRFAECLSAESVWADEIYLLGDLMEMWVGDDDDTPLARNVTQVLAAAADRAGVFLMHGNRDFLFGDGFALRAHLQLLEDPHLIDGDVLLSHGDAWCIDDQAYQQMRSMFRSAAWQDDILAKPLDERKALGQMLRARSRAENANKSSNIMDVNVSAVMQSAAAHNARTLIHGHTHRPGRHEKDDTRRYVLGSWERCGWLLRQSGAHFQLECFSLARRYESGTAHPAR